jgi:hypothetical protein
LAPDGAILGALPRHFLGVTRQKTYNDMLGKCIILQGQDLAFTIINNKNILAMMYRHTELTATGVVVSTARVVQKRSVAAR